jgi:CheY-like chemotaxis protein
MTPEVQARLFEPFFTTKERGRGTGLGLATVYGIVKQGLGHIWIYSEAGVGTTFKVYWPVADEGPLPAAPLTDISLGLPGIETVLVVEDEPALRALTARMLERHGYTVLLAGDGDDAARICAEHPEPIQVVLMDVMLPGMSGPAIAEWITRQRPEARIVYVSGYTDAAITHHGVLNPGTTFLQKPFTSEALLATIRRVLA